MVFKTKNAAYASLREFAPWLRRKHRIIKFWSNQDQVFRYTRVMIIGVKL
jgi:hypothetical protein